MPSGLQELANAASQADANIKAVNKSLYEFQKAQDKSGLAAVKLGISIVEAFGDVDERTRKLLRLIEQLAQVLQRGSELPPSARGGGGRLSDQSSALAHSFNAHNSGSLPVNINLHSPDMAGFQRSEGQLTTLFARALSRGFQGF